MEQKALAAHHAALRAARSNSKHLAKLLQEPKRRAAEESFSTEHQRDSDEALYAYVKEQKRRQGKRMKPATTVGYCYLTQRLGLWQDFMGRINRELAAEKQQAARSDG